MVKELSNIPDIINANVTDPKMRESKLAVNLFLRCEVLFKSVPLVLTTCLRFSKYIFAL